MKETELIALKEKIATAKTDLAELGGRKKTLLKTLKDDYNCSNVQEAEDKVESLQDEIDELDAAIEKGVSKLKKKLKGLLT